jgi:hypothetical protein
VRLCCGYIFLYSALHRHYQIEMELYQQCLQRAQEASRWLASKAVNELSSMQLQDYRGATQIIQNHHVLHRHFVQ